MKDKKRAVVKVPLRSMTGFGKAREKSPYGTITAEIKTLNHKHLSISCAPFEGLFLLEERLQEVMEEKVVRGKVFVQISRSLEGRAKPLRKLEINKRVAEEYLKKIQALQKGLSLKGEIKIQDVLSLPGVLEQNGEGREEKIWPYVKKAVEKALEKLVKFREAEGATLAKDFIKRLARIRDAVKGIKTSEKASVNEFRDRLGEKIKAVTRSKEVDKGRLEEEVALFARNCDIAEELVRLENHIDSCEIALKNPEGDVGKKLDFIAQEMHRETNTIGSKANDFRVSNAVIEIKSEIEKIREQLKNIE